MQGFWILPSAKSLREGTSESNLRKLSSEVDWGDKRNRIGVFSVCRTT